MCAPLRALRGGPWPSWWVQAVPPHGPGRMLKSPGPSGGIGMGVLKLRAPAASITLRVPDPAGYAHRADLAGTAGEGPARHLGTVRPLKRHQAPADRLSSRIRPLSRPPSRELDYRVIVPRSASGVPPTRIYRTQGRAIPRRLGHAPKPQGVLTSTIRLTEGLYSARREGRYGVHADGNEKSRSRMRERPSHYC